MLNSSIPNKFPLRWGQNAGAPYIRSIPSASQIGIQNGAASLNDGFPPLTSQPIGSGGVPPWGQDMNGILNQITAWNQWQQAGAAVQYDGSFSTSIGGYPKYAIVASTATLGLFWFNTVDSNTTDPDGGSPSGWIATGPAVNLLHYGTDAGTANALSVASVTPGVPVFTAGMLFEITKMSSANTAAMTGTIAGQAGNVTWGDTTALRPGDWPASSTGLVLWDGTRFRLLTSFIRTSAIQPSVDMVFYVNGATGNDSNDGLTSGTAFATITGAVSAIKSRYLSLNSATVNVANGTYNGFSISSSGIATWNFVGNTGSPSSCIISATSGTINIGRAVLVSHGANVTLNGFKFQSLYENVNCGSGNTTFPDGSSCVFTAPTQASQPIIGCYDSGFVAIYGTHTYSGSMGAMFACSVNSAIRIGYHDTINSLPLTLTASGTPSFSIGFAEAWSGGAIYVDNTNVSFGGSATGPRYSAFLNGTINVNGLGTTFFPGNSAGSTATGGQYA